MRKISIEINGAIATAEVEARTQLADFLRGERFLTGTHIGCEHGVCGACTVLIDGCLARSCITFAVACDGAKVTTIEGLRDDPIMANLRAAFSAHHALQCGYCTPAMLIACRDIVMRLPDADEPRVRLELSGNLCRCTGYVGIVAAVKEVLEKRGMSDARPANPRTELGPVGARAPAASQLGQRTVRRPVTDGNIPRSAIRDTLGAEQWRAVDTRGVELAQTFRVPFPRERVWEFFADLEQVARCMPGARLTTPPLNGRAEGEVGVKLGPIVGAFAGALEVERDDRRFGGVVRCAGRDARSGSNAHAVISYHVHALGEATSRVDVSVKFLLTGALAQFGRSGLVRDVVSHLTAMFAVNLETSLSGKPIPKDASAVLDAASLARAALWSRIRALFSKLTGN
ncbi:MAG: carbon monoxide dehydrogenase [Proteobacteria bacterium]|nr:carbon monoxide dehydrogenase [Pseudomonadota bacterium]